MRLRIYLICFSILLPFLSFGTHNRAGEITYEQTGPLTVFVTVTTYTKASSVQADRDSILVVWGDGTFEFVKRSNGNGVEIGNNTKYNIYQKAHTYPGRSTYTISVNDPNRVSNILNINNSNSENIQFYIETTFTFTNSTFDGENNSVQLLQPPIDIACVGQKFIHLPNAYDVDKDSIAFELITPLSMDGLAVPNYILPDQIIPGTNNQFTFDELTGAIMWNSPQKAGEYNVAFRVNEYRNGVLVTTMIRDMQIFVVDCNNHPPEIDVIDNVCVVAGDTVQFTISVDDVDSNQKVKLEATGAPLTIEPNSAVLDVDPIFQEPPFTATFTWVTRCEDIAKTPYQVVFRAVDNFYNEEFGLADLKAVTIQVLGPPPENIAAEGTNNSIEIFWDNPYACEMTEDEYFQGFSVWRKRNPVVLPNDTCYFGLSNTPYERITFPMVETKDGRYYFEDQNVEKGITYCYRVEAEFAKLTELGFPYNFVESIPSDEICVQTKRDIPVLTKVSVEETDASDGIIHLQWIKPNPIDLDTLANPGPYRYQLQRSVGIGTENYVDIPGASFQSVNFGDPVDTSFIDENLNTLDEAYTYRIAFYVGGQLEVYDYSPHSSSVYLDGVGIDRSVDLSWESSTSWYNELYTIFQNQPPDTEFFRVDSTSDENIIIYQLKNGTEYCFYLESRGTYILPEFPYPLINLSNEFCATPVDTIPPCTPEITVSNPCATATKDTPEEDFFNTIEWLDVTEYCQGSGDTHGYNVYYKQSGSDEFQFIEFVPSNSQTLFTHYPSDGLIACYAVSAVDSMGNESDLSVEFCINDCPLLILPNTFTPNDDGANDIFIPLISRFVSEVNMKIYNERGVFVYETTDPQINWNGTNKRGKALPDGVYYYVCNVYSSDMDGNSELFNTISGFIELIR